MLLFLDIETIGIGEKLNPQDFKPPGNYKSEEAINKWYATKAKDEVEKEYSKRGLSATKCRVLCIGYALEDDEIGVITGSEKEICDKLWEVMSSETDPHAIRFVGHNIRSFDIPKIYRMACKAGHKKLVNWFNLFPVTFSTK